MIFTPPQPALNILLQDAIRRDIVTARRMELLSLLLNERYLTREQLVIRVEGRLGADCFGAQAWEDTFYRDMRVVKEALRAAGYVLKYSRSKSRTHRPGYYLEGQLAVSETLSGLLRHSIEELDLQQLEIFRHMTPAERFRLGSSVTDAAVRSVAYRIRQRRPELTPAEASYFAIQGKLPQ